MILRDALNTKTKIALLLIAGAQCNALIVGILRKVSGYTVLVVLPAMILMMRNVDDLWLHTEYLRRVRWEAAQIPKVTVAKLNKSKLTKEQSVYMPEIPEIERCPEHLLPLKQWEEEFLYDFSDLRLAISRLDCSDNLGPVIVQSASNPVPTFEANVHSSLESIRPDGPTLSTILKMDLVARVCALKRRILLFESKDVLSRNDGLWLFALCAAIDTPLDADTSAVLRGLLRKCSKLRAEMSELDDETIMLNILVLISGKYFGQAEHST